MRIAINAALMKLRKNRTLREAPMDEPRDDGETQTEREVAESAAGPEESNSAQEHLAILREAISQLQSRYAIRSRRTIESMGRCPTLRRFLVSQGQRLKPVYFMQGLRFAAL
jgi:hypothetical protein